MTIGKRSSLAAKSLLKNEKHLERKRLIDRPPNPHCCKANEGLSHCCCFCGLGNRQLLTVRLQLMGKGEA